MIMKNRTGLYGRAALLTAAIAIGGLSMTAAQAQTQTDPGQPKPIGPSQPEMVSDEIIKDMKSAVATFNKNIAPLLEKCVVRQGICQAEDKHIGVYTGNFGDTLASQRIGIMVYVPGYVIPEQKGVWRHLIGSTISDPIFTYVHGLNGTTMTGSRLPGMLGDGVNRKYGRSINLDGGLQMLARVKVGGVMGEILKALNFPAGTYLARAGMELGEGMEGLNPARGRVTKPSDQNRGTNGYFELRYPGVWKNPFGWVGMEMRRSMFFMDQDGVIRMEGILSFSGDKREFLVLFETPTPGETEIVDRIWALRRVKIGIATEKMTLKDVTKLWLAMTYNGGTVGNVFPELSPARQAMKVIDLLPDVVAITNPKWGKYRIGEQSAPFPTAEKFNILGLASPFATHSVEFRTAEGRIAKRTVKGPHIQLLGDMEFLGMKFAGVDIHANLEDGLQGEGYASVRLNVGKVAGVNVGTLSGTATLKMKNDFRLEGQLDFGRVIGRRDYEYSLTDKWIGFRSPATCIFPFDIVSGIKPTSYKDAFLSAVKSALPIMPDPKTLAKCAGKLFYAVRDGVLYAFNETAPLVAMTVTDSAVINKIGDGLVYARGASMPSGADMMNAADKIGGALAKAVGSVKVSGLASFQKVGVNVGRDAKGAAEKIGKGIASSAKKTGCRLGIGSCKKKRKVRPGAPVAWQNLNAAGLDIAASVNTAEKSWMIGTHSNRPFLRLKGWKKYSESIAVLADGTEVNGFRKIAVGPRDALLLIDSKDRLYFSDGVRNGNRITVRPVPGITARDVAIQSSKAWVLSAQSAPGGQKIYRSAFTGLFSSLRFAAVSGGANALDVDNNGNAWIVSDYWRIRRYNGSGWDDVAPLIDASSTGTLKIENITVDKYHRPWVSLGGTRDNLFALSANGWRQYQGGTKALASRGGLLWSNGNGDKPTFYKAALPQYVPPGPASDWRYSLSSVLTESCWQAPQLSKERTSAIDQRIEQHGCAEQPGNPAQQFYLQAATGMAAGHARIVSVSSGLCVGIAQGWTGDGAEARLEPCDVTNQAQEWLVEGSLADGGGFRFKARHSGKCLQVMGGNAGDGNVYNQAPCSTAAMQRFDIDSLLKEQLPAGASSTPKQFKTAPVNWKRVLQGRLGMYCFATDTRNGMGYMAGCDGNNGYQQLRLIPDPKDPNWYSLYSESAKKCLRPYIDDKGVHRVVAMTCEAGSLHQKWGIQATEAGNWFHLVNRWQGKCLHMVGNVAGRGKQYDVVDCAAPAAVRSGSLSFRFFQVAAQ